VKKQRNWGMIVFGSLLIGSGIVGFGIRNAIHSYDVQAYEQPTTPIEDNYYEEGPYTEFSYRATQQLKADGIKVPLYLQTDERWKNEMIDYTNSLTMETHGSAIASMMMVLSYQQELDYDYEVIYELTSEDYFNSDNTLKWKFFEQASENYGISISNLGYHYEEAETHLKNGEPVIVRTKDGNLRVLDPLDSPDTERYKKVYTPSELTDTIQNYWAII
jgi:hypothetical protein